MTTLLTDAVEAMVGRTVTYRAPVPLGAPSIRYFAVAIGSDPDRWLEEAPPTLVCETAQLTGSTLRDGAGYLGHAWDLPLPVPCVMVRGGNDYRFFHPVRPGDVITTTWTLDAIDERLDRRGRPMLVVTTTARYAAAGGTVAATNTETLIYRAVEASS